MRKLNFSPLVKKKMKRLKAFLETEYGNDVSVRIMKRIMEDLENLAGDPNSGTNISATYEIDTDYWYLFTNQHYFIYRTEPEKVVVVQMFHEKTDFMMRLFGICGQTEESIDYWGE